MQFVASSAFSSPHSKEKTSQSSIHHPNSPPSPHHTEQPQYQTRKQLIAAVDNTRRTYHLVSISLLFSLVSAHPRHQSIVAKPDQPKLCPRQTSHHDCRVIPTTVTPATRDVPASQAPQLSSVLKASAPSINTQVLVYSRRHPVVPSRRPSRHLFIQLELQLPRS